MTDGATDCLYNYKEKQAVPLVGDLINLLDKYDEQTVSNELNRVLDSDPFRKQTRDDITLGIMNLH